MTDLLKPVEASPPETLHALVAMCGGKPLILCASKVILYDMDEIGAGRDLDDGVTGAQFRVEGAGQLLDSRGNAARIHLTMDRRDA